MIMKEKAELESLVEEQISRIGNPYTKIKYISNALKDPHLTSDERNYLAERSNQITDEAEKYSKTDGLTGVENRASFDEDLLRNISQVRRNSVRYGVQENQSLSLLMVDIDHFKQYNDDNGHVAGDYALKDAAETLSKYSWGASIYRYGGEEFAILMPETSPAQAEIAADRLNKFMRKHTDVTISIGMANYTAHVEDEYNIQTFDNAPEINRPIFEKNIKKISEELVEKADKALYYAKAEGRDRAVTYSPKLAQSFLEAVK